MFEMGDVFSVNGFKMYHLATVCYSFSFSIWLYAEQMCADNKFPAGFCVDVCENTL